LLFVAFGISSEQGFLCCRHHKVSIVVKQPPMIQPAAISSRAAVLIKKHPLGDVATAVKPGCVVDAGEPMGLKR
jgi:hypothetical protein